MDREGDTCRNSTALAWMSMAVQMSSKKSNFGVEFRSLMGYENRASHKITVVDKGRVCVSRGASHRLGYISQSEHDCENGDVLRVMW